MRPFQRHLACQTRTDGIFLLASKSLSPRNSLILNYYIGELTARRPLTTPDCKVTTRLNFSPDVTRRFHPSDDRRDS
ncbi:hypothetical protein DPMN_189754 [Dreissena polymorpha]|uniref:Uncharacterized protein n=1 Tax=Dreissena polymorpha TaxID=45954 RepID=A0A9D4DUM6_DREPO|nr:hypothetical protein DPMN_189754 [Dreissena polymorpha]